jgi:hypothetical protein
MHPSRVPRLAAALLCLSLAACASHELDLVNPVDGSPRLAARADSLAVTGGGSATSRGWHRGVIASFTLRNLGAKKRRLARGDVLLELGFRHVAAHTRIGSEKSGPVEAVAIPPRGTVDVIAQFSTSLGIKKTGTVVLRVGEAGSERKVEVEVPIRLHAPPDLEDEPPSMDRAGVGPARGEQGG